MSTPRKTTAQLCSPTVSTLAIAAAFCVSLAAPGNAQAPPKADTAKQNPLGQLKTFQSGTVAGGVYEPSAQEKALECKRLLGSMRIIISKLKAPTAIRQPSELAIAAENARASIAGGSKSLQNATDDNRERARLEAYNRLLVEKQCKPLDLKAELAAKPEQPAPLPPASPPKR